MISQIQTCIIKSLSHDPWVNLAIEEYLMRHYNLSKQLRVILQTVAKLGIKAEFSGRNDLMIGEKKFSGNASYFNKDSALHHGTIFINSDLTKLSRYLRVSRAKTNLKSIDSVRSRVVNLAEVCQVATLPTVIKSMKESFLNVYEGDAREIAVDRNDFYIEPLVKKYSSWEWRFGNTPKI